MRRKTTRAKRLYQSFCYPPYPSLDLIREIYRQERLLMLFEVALKMLDPTKAEDKQLLISIAAELSADP